MRRASRPALWLVLAAAIGACGAPAEPEIPPRSEIGPPAEAASPPYCLPPYPRDFGNDWYLLADLDQGTACYAYLERDECVLGVFVDCTDGTEDRRQWRGRVDVEVDRTTAELTPLFPANSNGTRLPRQPVCCQGEVTSSATQAWSMMRCNVTQCGHISDISHAGLYLERRTPDVDPASRILTQLDLPTGSQELAFDESTQTIWGVARNQAFMVDGGSGGTTEALALNAGRKIAAQGGFTYVVDEQTLRILHPEAPLALPLPGDVVAMHGRAQDLLMVLNTSGGPTFWQVDGLTGTVTASAAAPDRVTGLHGSDPTYLTTQDSIVYAVQADLTYAPHFDSAESIMQTGGAITPSSPWATRAGVGFIAACHPSSRRVHCVFEAEPGNGEPARFAVAGVERLQELFLDTARSRWITVSLQGRVTQLLRDSGRPLLQEQVRIDDAVRGSVYVAQTQRLYVLHGNQRLSIVDLSDAEP